ncbi:MAG TPA: putative toxin-antitoxin system toxin component, PIN family [Fimbriiglobus sp.]|nr:putative toxin-antitoxin system toxin component, PIN family [Fimbriiglobus sp.]
MFDCVVLLQAAGSPAGPAGRCIGVVASRAAVLCVSDESVAELSEVLNRPGVRRKFHQLTDERVADFLAWLDTIAVRVDPVLHVFTLKRDPDDSKYLDLAHAAGAKFIVSRDNDLLDLMTGTDADAVAFRTTCPDLVILDPVAFLQTVQPPTVDPNTPSN